MERMLERLNEALPECDTADAVWAVGMRVFAALGFDRVLYLDKQAASQGEGGAPDAVTVLSSFSFAWVTHYQNSGYALDDPFPRYCATTYQPRRTGIDHLAEHQYLEERERRIIEESGDDGFRSGVSCTTRLMGPAGFSAWNLGSTLPRQDVDKLLLRYGDQLRLSAFCVHDRLSQFPVMAAPSLSGRERQCLERLCAGQRVKQIAWALSLAEVTVELHIANARRKLGARTREEAVARALRWRLIEP
ncbi:LuxR family transcriptional regulator [Alcanivorax sp. JB21]|uniref:helix-turn-helix transcriptional regulator n=1 Tax=Alcanivorax limicola TaxID=2874102 RepID=UPI001CBF992D|nr:LuxR family transcriptional regulator [Alcanivorax limicola]MBZ2188476.1 LuxR family transcriptional regulator [Alcanivorax limicola]